MSETGVRSATGKTGVGRVDMKLEVQIIPVSDVDRSKGFYERLGWRLDDDVAPLDGLRIVQFTPPGSGTSITFGKGLTTAAPGSAEGGLIVSDIEAAHDELVGRGIDVSDVWHGPPFPPEAPQPGPDPERTSYGSFFSFFTGRAKTRTGPPGMPPTWWRSRPGVICRRNRFRAQLRLSLVRRPGQLRPRDRVL
jgi:catechol 2,3-dioxygenase-like lactoylglutathione lyase family enzyme